MEKMVVFGKKKINFDTKDGKHVEGIKLHCTKEPPNASWTGYGYEGIFVDIKSDLYKVADTLPVQTTINCDFNRYGKVNSFEVVK